MAGQVDDLVSMEQCALEHMRANQWNDAIHLLTKIVVAQPDWEHGGGFYDLACCLEETSDFAAADRCYREALKYNPRNTYFLGGYASFLYLHGSASDAYSIYLELIDAEGCGQKVIDECMPALKSLAERLQRSESQLSADLERIRRSL